MLFLKMKGVKNMTIDWTRFEENFIRLDTGIEKKLRLTNWRPGNWFNMPGIGFDVLEEDDVDVKDKVFTTTSKRLIRKLRPIIEKTTEQGLSEISVAITRVGEGTNTHYIVREQ
jgi:hypothetical protein